MAHMQQRSGFSDVDASDDPEALVRFLDERSASPFFERNRRRRLDALALGAGDRVLEVGCGVGDFSRELMTGVGRDGSVVGVDASEVMLRTAQARSTTASGEPAYAAADAARLPFADATFDACTTERVLFHLEDAAAAVREMVRVARPGARIAVFEPDWGTMTLNAPNRAVTETVLSLYAGRLASPWAARQLSGIFRSAGLTDVVVQASTHIRTERLASTATGGSGVARALRRAVEDGLVTADDARAWGAGLREMAGAGAYFFSLTFFLVSGRKP
jgi:ubiquinone/menaquinone biosynthesis C-methylase UbiE